MQASIVGMDSENPSDAPAKASKLDDATFGPRSALKGAGAWLTGVGRKAKDAALVAGQHLDKAAISVGQKVDQYSQQVWHMHIRTTE